MALPSSCSKRYITHRQNVLVAGMSHEKDAIRGLSDC